MVGDLFNICMRVESAKSRQFMDGSTGWLHPVNGCSPRPSPRKPERDKPFLDCTSTLRGWADNTSDMDIERLASALGVSPLALRALGCVRYQCTTYAFPMRDGKGGIIGIRLRNLNGAKWAVEGSHNGLFIPTNKATPRCLICEGPTDTAAALSIGAFAIGRPSCSAGVLQIVEAVRRLRIQEVVIVSDCDEAGMRGAITLTLHLSVPCCILVLPCKDMRQFVNQGGDVSTLDALVKQLVWRRKDNAHLDTTAASRL